MPRGGYRPGAGRPKGSRSGKGKAEAKPAIAGPKGELTPLDYMLAVMNDPAAETWRRDRMAIAAAAYKHGRPGAGQAAGKKDRQAEAAGAAASSGRFATPAAPKLVVDNK